MKKYIVTKTYTQQVEAMNESEAEEKAEEQHMDSPEYDTEVKRILDNELSDLIITISATEQEEGGYMYNIYYSEEAMKNGHSADGGQCTGSMVDALGMATEQAKIIIKHHEFK